MNNKRVTLVGHYGSDESIALAAWTSTSRELTEDKKNRIPQMISNLYNSVPPHKSPFERGIVHFLVEAEISSHIQLIKHRTMGTNGESARYKELKEDKYYLPEDWKGIRHNEDYILTSPEGSIRYIESGTHWTDILEEYVNLGNHLYHKALKDLTPNLGRKRAKESARFFKTYNSVLTTDCIMNMSCFDNVYKLRHSKHAQLEIYNIVGEMADLIEQIEGNPFETTMRLIRTNDEYNRL